ncbi:MAG: hypothetical protein ACOCRZ_04695, partial [Halothermotrichaceae bacterium]
QSAANAGQYTASQYNPQGSQSNMQNAAAQQTGIQYAQNKSYYQSSNKLDGGVNKYGANFSSGNKDSDIGQAYYQSNKGF